MRMIEKNFPPEFLGRIKEDIVVFRPLTKRNLIDIVDMRIEEHRMSIKNNYGIDVVVNSRFRKMVINEVLDHPEFGARLVGDKVNKYLINPMAKLINTGQVDVGDHVEVSKKRDERTPLFKKIR